LLARGCRQSGHELLTDRQEKDASRLLGQIVSADERNLEAGGIPELEIRLTRSPVRRGDRRYRVRTGGQRGDHRTNQNAAPPSAAAPACKLQPFRFQVIDSASRSAQPIA
jgi:hypothetical protein